MSASTSSTFIFKIEKGVSGKKALISRFTASSSVRGHFVTFGQRACASLDEQIKNISHIIANLKEIIKILVFVRGVKAQSFVSLAKDHIFVVPNLVLFGLNPILNHNVE